MKIDLSQFSHLQSELPKQDKRKIKIYIAYKAEVSRYLAYIVYKELLDCGQFDLFYDRACIQPYSSWKDDLNINMNQCDIVLIIGEKGAFDSFKLKKYGEDEFIKEIKSGFDKNKDVYYIPINGYHFWEKEYDEILSEKRVVKQYGNRLNKLHLESLSLRDESVDIFELKLSRIKKALIKNSEKYLQKQISEELKRQSTSELQRDNNRF